MPFPPLNPSQTGNMCPITAAMAAAIIQRALLLPSAQRLAIRTAAYPFAASSSKVRRPAPSPALRATFAAPIFPLPCSRISSPSPAFTIRKPNGIEPSK